MCAFCAWNLRKLCTYVWMYAAFIHVWKIRMCVHARACSDWVILSKSGSNSPHARHSYTYIHEYLHACTHTYVYINMCTHAHHIIAICATGIRLLRSPLGDEGFRMKSYANDQHHFHTVIAITFVYACMRVYMWTAKRTISKVPTR